MKYQILYGLDEVALFDNFDQANIFTAGLTALGQSYSMGKVAV